MKRSLLRSTVLPLIAVTCAVLFLCSCVRSYFTDSEKSEVIEHLRAKINETLPYSEDMVFWTKGGNVYHLYEDCRFLEKSNEVSYGTIAQSGRTKLCESCAKRLDETDTEEEPETEIATNELTETETIITESKNITVTETESETITAVAPLEEISTENKDPVDRTLPDEVKDEQENNNVNNTQKVYWTPSGSVWHVDPNCSALSRSSDIRSGTIEESGKPRACKKCSD